MAEKTYFYYRCDVYSKVGRQLTEFWRAYEKAQERAEQYAQKAGATSYVQPVEYFGGGVEYVSFDKEPDPLIWRKRLTDADGVVCYEPNCVAQHEIMCIPDHRMQPSDKWNMLFSKERFTWKEAKQMKPLRYWLKAMGKTPSSDEEADKKLVEEHFQYYAFVPFIHFVGSDDTDYRQHETRRRDGNKKRQVAPRALREAVYMEKTREQLPTVQAEWLFAILGIEDAVSDASKGKAPVLMRETPTFFIYRDTYYLRVIKECKAEGLHLILPSVYATQLENARAQQQMDDEEYRAFKEGTK